MSFVERPPGDDPYDVAAWWVKYLLPPRGVLLDGLSGSGTMLAAGLGFGASQVVGIEKEQKYWSSHATASPGWFCRTRRRPLSGGALGGGRGMAANAVGMPLMGPSIFCPAVLWQCRL